MVAIRTGPQVCFRCVFESCDTIVDRVRLRAAQASWMTASHSLLRGWNPKFRKVVKSYVFAKKMGVCATKGTLWDAVFETQKMMWTKWRRLREPKTKEARVSCSPREREIARMVAKGYPNKAIAAVLEISLWTVGTHLRHVFVKLHVSSRAAMVARMIEAALIKKVIDD